MPRSQKRQKDNKVVSLFALLESARAKVPRRTLMKLTPERIILSCPNPKESRPRIPISRTASLQRY